MSNRARSGRGFSFMTDPESDAAALKFIERDDLDRTWKSTIRERQKVQETRIWEDFCQNQDILQSIYQDDPYQFLENLPDTYIKELERIEKFDVNSVIQENSVQPESLAGGDSSNTCIQVRGDGEDFIPFIQEPTAESETTDRQLSLESEKEEGDQPQEIYIQSPCTVRESTKHEQQLSACDQQYYSLGQQHPDRDHQHSGRDLLHSGLDQIHSGRDQQHSGRDQQHYGRDQQHSGRDQQHSGRDQQYGRDLLHAGLDQIHSGRDQQHSGRDQPNSGRAQYSNKQTPQNSDRTKEKCELKKIKKDNVVSKPSPTPAFEANMYFEKVRGLRFKINEVLLCIIELFDDQIEDDYDPIEIRKLQKRANEFSGRFTRIYMYQLSRQLNDLKRSMKLSLPFAKRTQFQSQVTRVVSLHQNTLQALQVFHRPLETALCLGDSGHHLQSLVKFIRESSELCADVVPSNDLRPKVEDMYNDDIPISCFKIEKLLKKYLIKLRVMMEAAAEPTPRSAKPAKTSSNQRDAKQLQLPYRRKMASQKRKHSPKYNTGARLSMYSLDNLRLNLNPKQTVSKENQTSKVDTNAADKPGSVSQTNLVKYPGKHSPFPRKSAKKPDKKEAAAEAAKKSQSQVASSRKPLMRDSNKAGGPTKKKNVRDEDIRTMVETFGSNCVTNRSWSEKAQSPSPKSAALSAKSPKSTGLSANSPKSVALSPKSAAPSPKSLKTAAEPEKEQRGARGGATGCDVTRLLHRLCGGAGERPPNANRNERVSGASNAQLVCVSSNSPRPTSTPQLLKILEENIQKKSSPFPVEHPETSAKSNIPEKLLLHFNIPEQTSDSAQNYRTQFIQYMMSSPMYANSALKKPWEMIGRVSDKIIEELLLSCVAEMQLEKVLQEIYCSEVN